MRFSCLLLISYFVLACHSNVSAEGLSAPLKVGDKAPDFKLQSLDGEEFSLFDSLGNGPTILVVLRGYPGYQCPICSKQVSSLIDSASKFADSNATVLLIYPGPQKQLEQRAKEFLENLELPKNYQFVTDPDYHFTNSYSLRWDAPAETAYPSTFVVAPDRTVTFARVSKSHGGRAKTANVLKALEKHRAAK